MMMRPLSCVGELFSCFSVVEHLFLFSLWALFFCSKRSSSSSSSRAPVPITPLLSQSGGDIFAAIVPPLRSSVRLGDFMKKKIAK